MASALLQSTHVLLLDEADNYLDLPAVIWLQGYIQSLPHTVITISHDREFSDNVSDELIVLRKNTLAYFDGNLTEYERQQRKKYKHAVKQQEALDRKKEKVEKSIEDNLRQAKKSGDDNKLRMVKSRQTKLDERWGLETSAKGTRFKLNRDTQGYFLTSRQGIEIDAPDRPMNFAFQDPEPLRFPGALVHLDDVSFTFKEASKPTLRNVNFTLGEGERAAYVGPNGHGKVSESERTNIEDGSDRLGVNRERDEEAMFRTAPKVSSWNFSRLKRLYFPHSFALGAISFRPL